MRHHSRATLKLCAPKSCEFLMEIVCAVNASWSNGAVLAVLEQFTGSKYFLENNEKEESTEILKNNGDVLKIDITLNLKSWRKMQLKVTPILSWFLRRG